MHIGERREWGGKYSRRSGQLMKTLPWENSAIGIKNESEKKERKWKKGRKDTIKRWKTSNYKGVKWKTIIKHRKEGKIMGWEEGRDVSHWINCWGNCEEKRIVKVMKMITVSAWKHFLLLIIQIDFVCVLQLDK